MISRADAEAVFWRATRHCEPAAAVAAALARLPASPSVVGIAIGKAAQAMARGAGAVTRGLVVTPADDGEPLPPGWVRRVAAHPIPDARSEAAGHEVQALVDRATGSDRVLALISGGGSALVELPLLPLAELVAITSAVMARGAPIEDLNAVRGALSAIKAGGLVAACAAHVTSLVASDVIGDDLRVIGSGPTTGPWLAAPGARIDLAVERAARQARAIAILERYGLAIPAILRAPIAPCVVTRDDHAAVILAMARFAAEVGAGFATPVRVLAEPLAGEVEAVAARLAHELAALPADQAIVAWGEPTVSVPADPGEGGRAQQLALALARHLRGTTRSALVAGSDGIDGPVPRDRPPPAGAFVDGETWDALVRAGVDPDRSLTRRDAGSALAAIGALVVTGPTGINHADVVIAG
ncbi:MAG: DUF4147 domain-containing protein [Kofleriaceae bacterium]